MIRANKISGRTYSQIIKVVSHESQAAGSTHQIACEKDDLIVGWYESTTATISSTDFDILEQDVKDGVHCFLMIAKSTGTLSYTTSASTYAYFAQLR